MFVMSWPVPTWFNCPIDWSPISTCSFGLRMEDESVLQRLLALGYHSFKIVRQSPHSGMTLGRKNSRSHQIILGCYTCKFGRNLISVWLDCLSGAALGQHSIWHVICRVTGPLIHPDGLRDFICHNWGGLWPPGVGFMVPRRWLKVLVASSGIPPQMCWQVRQWGEMNWRHLDNQAKVGRKIGLCQCVDFWWHFHACVKSWTVMTLQGSS